jgi:hypothetical protein
MKKIILILSAFVLFISCTDDITGLNEDTKNPTIVPAAFLFTNAQKNIVDQMVSTNVNNNVFRLFTQYWTETTYTDESNYDITTRTIPDNHWGVIYRDVLRDLLECKKVLSTEAFSGTPQQIADQNAIRKNKEAIIDILTAYCYSVLVDTFGNVPYSQALNLETYTNPKYDDGLVIYKDLIKKLTVSVTTIDDTKGSFDNSDLIYGGDMSHWKKFGNTLRLKLAINLDDLDHAYASAEALAAVTAGVFVANADNAALKYKTVQPNTNPLYVDVVASGRDDFVPTKTIIDKMNTLSDPRLSSYFTDIAGSYTGGTPGASNNFANFSHIGSKLLDPSFEGLIMDYTEVEFLLAEAVERNIAVGGTASDHYNKAITASMEYWGVSSGDIATYLALPTVDYATATGNWKQKIGEQAYLGLYNRGFEAWTTYRRLDFPVLTAPSQASITEVPKRYTYPSAEQTLNGINYKAAATSIGGDKLTTKLFWDKF